MCVLESGGKHGFDEVVGPDPMCVLESGGKHGFDEVVGWGQTCGSGFIESPDQIRIRIQHFKVIRIQGFDNKN